MPYTHERVKTRTEQLHEQFLAAATTSQVGDLTHIHIGTPELATLTMKHNGKRTWQYCDIKANAETHPEFHVKNQQGLMCGEDISLPEQTERMKSQAAWDLAEAIAISEERGVVFAEKAAMPGTFESVGLRVACE